MGEFAGAGDGLDAVGLEVEAADDVVAGVGDVEGVVVEGEALGVVEASGVGGSVAEAWLAFADDVVDLACVGLDGEDAVVA